MRGPRIDRVRRDHSLSFAVKLFVPRRALTNLISLARPSSRRQSSARPSMRPTMRDDSTSGGAVRMRGNSVPKNRPGFQKGSDLRILRAAVHFGWNRFGIIDGHAFTPV